MPAGDAVTWLGHSTVVVELDGHRAITDPVLTDRVAHLRRRRPHGLDLDAVVDVDVVLVSHVHMDHLHRRSLRAIDRRATLVVPAGAAPLVDRLGFHDVVEVRRDETLALGGLEVRAFPARHPRGRGPHSTVTADPLGYVVTGGRRSVYFAGDTDLFPRMGELAGVDVALLPIWGWGATIGEGHLDPGRAVAATALLDPAHVVPIHWGTLAPEDGRRRVPTWFDTPAEQFRDALSATQWSDRLRLLSPGDRLPLDVADGDDRAGYSAAP